LPFVKLKRLYSKKNNKIIVPLFIKKVFINNYTDLQKSGINTKEKSWNHWIFYGEEEGITYKITNKNVLCDKIKVINTQCVKDIVIFFHIGNFKIFKEMVNINIAFFQRENVL
jgi:hypothetical protein